MSTIPNPSTTRRRQHGVDPQPTRKNVRAPEKHPILRPVLFAALLAVLLDLSATFAIGGDWGSVADLATWVMMGAFILSFFLLAVWRHSKY